MPWRTPCRWPYRVAPKILLVALLPFSATSMRLEYNFSCEWASYDHVGRDGVLSISAIQHCTVNYFLVDEAYTEIPSPFVDGWRSNGFYRRSRETLDTNGDGLIDCFKSVVAGGNYALTQGKDYGWRTLNGQPDFHGGVDIAAAEGSTILNAKDGRIVEAGFDANNGNYVRIDHSDGTQTVYLHMQYPAPVNVDQIVVVGSRLGKVGNTGHSFGSHLHFQIWTKQDGPRNEQTDTQDPTKAFDWNC